jgi:hypothetical protein
VYDRAKATFSLGSKDSEDVPVKLKDVLVEEAWLAIIDVLVLADK